MQPICRAALWTVIFKQIQLRSRRYVNPFRSSDVKKASFHGRISTIRADEGFENYLNLCHYQAMAADPAAGTIGIFCGVKRVTLRGRVEIRLEYK